MDKLFQFVNLLPMPVWLAMMVAPRAQVTQKASRSSVVFGLAALSYVFSLLLSVVIGRKQGSAAISPADFTSLDGIRKGLGTKEGALAAWSHMLALDLFAGAWIYRKSMRLDAPGLGAGAVAVLHADDRAVWPADVPGVAYFGRPTAGVDSFRRLRTNRCIHLS